MAASAQTQAQQRMETQLAAAAQTMLDNVVGSGNAAVRVHADLDFDQRETTTQSYQYTPNTPPISSATSTETYTGTGQVPGGVVGTGTGTTTTTTTTTGTGTSNQYQKSSSTATNAVGSTTEKRTGAAGTVKRLTVAVLLNGTAQAMDTTALSTLVANAVGLDTTRGDTIALTPMTFDSSAKDAAAAELSAAADAQSRAALLDLIKKVLIALLVIAVIVMAFLSGRRQRRSELDADELAAIGFAQPLALTRGDTEIALVGSVVAAVPEEPRAIEAATAEIQDLVAKQPDEVAQLLRGWIASGR
jgi:flagellar M-ring protein FliF